VTSWNSPRLDWSSVDRVYADAVFVIAAHVPGADLQRQAGALWTHLVTANVRVCVSTLAIDEMWQQAIRIMYGKDNRGDSPPSGDVRVLQQYSPALVSMTDKLLAMPNVQLLPVREPIDVLVREAMQMVTQYSFYPRDAFHAALAKAHGIRYAITNDRHWREARLSTPAVIRFDRD
jgi:predicted nucleic acid-binding protein